MADPCSAENRIASLETGHREIARAISATKEAILDELGEFREQLFGNGKLNSDGTQAGIFPLIDRRISAVERRTEFEDRVREEVEKRASGGDNESREIRKLNRRVERYRDELAATESASGKEKLRHYVQETPMWARFGFVLAAAMFGPGWLVRLAEALERLYALWQ